ncbi:MAG: hypothetical protein RL637_1150 [Pseudomonadota bacterium]
MAWFNRQSTVSLPAIQIQFDRCCYSLILKQIVNQHTNAEALWQKKFTAYPQICEKNSGNTQYRLCQALAKNPAMIHRYDDKLKRSRPEEFIYSDVLIWLPQAIIDRETRQNTGALSSLTTNLPVLHQDYFSATQWLAQRKPHYALLGSNLLAADEVGFQFGHGIYVAGREEIAQAELEAVYVDDQGQAHPFSPAISYLVDSQRPSAKIYPQQQTILLVKPREHLCYFEEKIPWFSDICQHLQLQRQQQEWQLFANSHSGDAIQIQRRQQADSWIFDCRDTTVVGHNADSAYLRLIIKPLAAHSINSSSLSTTPPVAEAQRPVINQATPTNLTSASQSQPIWGRTLIPGLNQAQMSQTQSYRTVIPNQQTSPLLILEGLALSRIDHPQTRVSGLKQWTIWFDAEGNIVDGHNSIDRHSLAAICANDRQACAYFKNALQNFSPLTQETIGYLGGKILTILPSPIPDRFHAIIQLPNPIQFILQANQTYTVGRQTPESIPEIDLTLLNDPQGMEWENHSPYRGSCLSMLSLSRNHLCFVLKDQELLLTVPTNKQPVYLLNAHLNLKEILNHSQHTSECRLKNGEYLLLGSFLLKFTL